MDLPRGNFLNSRRITKIYPAICHSIYTNYQNKLEVGSQEKEPLNSNHLNFLANWQLAGPNHNCFRFLEGTLSREGQGTETIKSRLHIVIMSYQKRELKKRTTFAIVIMFHTFTKVHGASDKNVHKFTKHFC